VDSQESADADIPCDTVTPDLPPRCTQSCMLSVITGDGRRRLLTALGDVHRPRQVLSTQTDISRLFEHMCCTFNK